MDKNLKVALVHDYLREYGGAEKVVEVLHELFPEAPVFTAYYNPQGVLAEKVKGWDIRTSWIQKIPGANRLISPFRILAPWAFSSFDLSEYDVVISSSAIYFAKAVKVKPSSLHLAYIHTPPRYLYNLATSFNYKKHWWTKVGAEVMNHFLRLVDFETSQRPDILIANSENVKQRIKKFYRRDAVVIYPPVEVEELKLKTQKSKVLPAGRQVKSANQKFQSYYLSLSRLWKGKGVDLIVEACSKLGLPLKVTGEGPELENLRKIGGSSVEFLGQVPDEEKAKLYAETKALIVAAKEEDFGITVVEAMACGTPVIALKEGGYLETVVEGKTGEFFPSTHYVRSGQVVSLVDSLVEVLKNFDPGKYKAEECRKQAEKFSKESFQNKILSLIQSNVKN